MTIGAGITVIADRSTRAFRDDKVLLKAHVLQTQDATSFDWRCGSRTGTCYLKDEGLMWAYGHGPRARAALLAGRAL